MSNNNSSSTTRLLILALVLIFVGGLLAWLVQTGGNTIKVKDVRFAGSNGKINSALLYIPPGVDIDTGTITIPVCRCRYSGKPN